MKIFNKDQKNDFGTPHCRIVKTGQEDRKGKYKLELIAEDIGMENPNTFGYGPLAPKAGEEII